MLVVTGILSCSDKPVPDSTLAKINLSDSERLIDLDS